VVLGSGWYGKAPVLLRVTLIGLGLVGLGPSCAASWVNEPVAINGDASPGSVEVHSNSGGRRIVRLNETVIAIVPHQGHEKTYRKVGKTRHWQEIDDTPGKAGALISGPNGYVYHFYRYGEGLYMVKFTYDHEPPAPQEIYSDAVVSEGGHGAYNMLTATVDQQGVLYVVTHWDDQESDGGDSLYCLSSRDHGKSWSAPRVIRQGSGAHSWGYAHLDVNAANELLCVYSEWESKSIQLSTSIDQGDSWQASQLASGCIYNPAILPVGTSELYVFAQSCQSDDLRGLVFRKSSDSGVTWTNWRMIDGASLSGYADPSPGLASNGDIYVAYRSGARPDLATTAGGAACRERVARSSDGGRSWSFPDNYFYDQAEEETYRTGTRSQVRYQTWFNYGGPLEWIWMQYDDASGEERRIYYDINTEVQIRQSGAVDDGSSEGQGEQGVLPPLSLLLS
jgi:hypothetical protein